MGTRCTLTGEILPPKAPATASALAAGEIGLGQLRVITETLVSLPCSVPEPARQQAEAELAGYARDFDPRRLRIIAHRMLAFLDPDGPEPADDGSTAPGRGELWLRDRRDGRLGVESWLDAEHGNQVRALIEQLAARRPDTGGVPDTRTLPARQADALIELCDRARATEQFPTTGGEPPHVSVTVPWDALRTGLGTAALDYGQLISAATARRMAAIAKSSRWCSAASPSRWMSAGRNAPSRWVSAGRWSPATADAPFRAVTGRPGCARPTTAGTRSTAVRRRRRTVLLCSAHHQQVHRQGWDITVSGGRVEFRPPAIIDPDRRPITNPLRR